MRNYPLCQKISENTHVSTEKEKFPTSFLHFAFFSKLVFCVSKNSFTPLISAISSPIGLKFFLVRLQTIWVGRFFFVFGYLVPIRFGRFRKPLGVQKIQRFCKVLSILVLQHEVFGIFEKQKKNVRPDWVPLSTVKFSAQTDEICGFAGGKLFASF